MKTIINDALNVLAPIGRGRLLKLILLDIAVSLLDIFFLVSLLGVVDFYTNTRHQPVTVFSNPVFKQSPILLITAFLILFTLKNGVAYQVIKRQHNFVYEVASRISKDKLLQYLRGNFNNYVDTDSSIHIHRINQQPIEFSHYVLKGILQISSQAILLLITLIIVLVYNAQVFLLLFALLIPPVLIVGYILKKKLHAARTNAKSTSEKSLQHLQEALSGYVESKIYNKEKFFTARYHTQQNRLNKYLSQQEIIQNMPARFIEVFAVFGLFVLVVINTINTHTATLSLVTVGAFIAASYKIIPGIVKIINSIGQIKTYAYTCKNLLWSEMNYTNSMSDENGGIESFALNKVSFSYKKAKVLNNFSVNVRQGDFLGLSGASGKGKTSMLNLLLGFILPADGEINFNEIEKLQAERHWKKIAYVKQQPFLLNDTVRTNITLHDSFEDDEKLLEVIKVTGVDHIIQESSSGLDTTITEHGRNLSGGQRQRIALARALYKDFDLLVLDEPFSELDEESEMVIMHYLKQIAANGKMVVLITHNKNALSFCNKTVSMDEYN